MQGNLLVPFLEGLEAVMLPGYPAATFLVASIMHLDAPLKNARSGKFQNAGVETAPALLANPETGRDVSLDLCRLESSRYGYDHKSNVGPCQGPSQSAKS